MDLLREKMYVKELELRMSCSYGPGRYDAGYEIDGHDYPINHARWTEQRNLELFLSLLAQRRLTVDDLITDKFRVDQASEAYALVKAARPESFGILFDYGLGDGLAKPGREAATIVRRPVSATGRKIRIGLIGVGAYAKNVHIPNLRALADDFEIAGVASRSGGTAAVVGGKADAAIITSDYRVLLDNKDVDAVLISTRHAAHARMIMDALDAGKHVFVEKPMTTTIVDGEAVAAKAAASGLIVRVGFNRRFAPHMRTLKHAAGTGRRMFSARINIGDVGKHWSSGAEEGGRFLGEGVHFIDLANWMFDAEPDRVAAAVAGTPELANPNLAITLSYPGGCAAQILYTTLGNVEMGKEYYEFFGSGLSGYCRDFSELKIFGGRVPANLPRGDKGQKDSLREFALAVKGDGSAGQGADARAGLAATRVALEIQDFVRVALPGPEAGS
jgi:predicted dehydrogenase